MIKYTKKRDKILKDGHTMLSQDIVNDLNRKSYLEDQRTKLIEFYIRIDGYDYKEIQETIKDILFE